MKRRRVGLWFLLFVPLWPQGASADDFSRSEMSGLREDLPLGASRTPLVPDPRDWTQGKLEQPVGFYSEGHLLHADLIPVEGVGFVKIFRPRDRGWASLDLIAVVSHAALRVASLFPDGERLQIGDVSARRGGQLSAHASHQVGLDADLVYFRKDHREMNPVDVSGFDELFVKNGKLSTNFDAERCFEFVKALVSTRRIDRIFVDPKVKKGLCEYAKTSGEFSESSEPLRRLRPYPNHANHMHVRLTCPAMSPRCVRQKDPPPGSGCAHLRPAPGRWDG